MTWRFLPILILYAGIHVYFWHRLIRRTAPPRAVRLAALIGLALIALGMPLAAVLARTGLTRDPLWIMPAFFWMGFGLYLLMGLLGTDLLRLGLALGARLRPKAGWSTHRHSRRFQRWLAGAALAFALAMSTSAFIGARNGPLVRNVEVTLDRLPQSLDGFRLVQISDLHVGQTIGRDYVERVRDLVAGLDPQLIAITGDLVDGRPEDIADRLEPLLTLRPPHGIYFVSGNHDHYSGLEPWLSHLRQRGVHVLDNRRETIAAGTAALDLAGVSDSRFGADLDRALAGRDPSRALILMAHRPREIVAAARRGVDLQISGHTHGGQFWPGMYIAPLLFPYVQGLHTFEDTQIYVSRGSGYVGPPMRLGAPSEVTLIRLRSGRVLEARGESPP